MEKSAAENQTPVTGPNPSGLCMCECEQHTKLAPRSDKKKGWVKGQPICFVHGHNRRKADRIREVDCGFTTPCHEWQLAKNAGGYGRVGVGGRSRVAHRVAWEAKNDPISSGMTLDHLCRNRACVNPDHLEVVTQAENVRRGDATKLTPEDAAEIRAASGRQKEIAAKYGVCQATVSKIKNGKAWR